MVLETVVHARYEKIGMLPFITKVTTNRKSQNRPKGAMEVKLAKSVNTDFRENLNQISKTILKSKHFLKIYKNLNQVV